MIVTILELIISILGTILNSSMFSVLKKVKDKFDFSFSIYYINIAYFSSSSAIMIILFLLRQFRKIEQSFGYNFGSYATLLYSYLSKFIAVFNIFIFLYLLGFSSMVTISINTDYLKDILPVTNIGLGGEVDLILGTPEGVKLDCDSMDCYDNEKEENVPNIEYKDFFIFVFSVIFSFLFMFFNGASFSSENTRITKLIKGKMEINFFRVQKISIFDEKFCSILNSITCYRLTILQLLNCISVLCLINFTCLLTSFIIGLTLSWPQAIFFNQNVAAPIGLVLSIFSFIASIYCKNVECCDFNSPPSKRKCIMIILLCLTILFFPLQILGFVTVFSSQLGHSSVKIKCSDEKPCDEFFTIIDNYHRTKYVFDVDVFKSKGNQIFGGFILGALPLFSYFFIMVLMVSFIRRSMNEFSSLNIIYEPKLYSLEENGQKFDMDLIEVITETVKANKGNDKNEENKGNEVTVYTRRIKTNCDQNN